MEELDHILLDQYHSAQRRLKTMKKLKKLFKNDEGLLQCEKQAYLTLEYIESMIKDYDMNVKEILTDYYNKLKDLYHK